MRVVIVLLCCAAFACGDDSLGDAGADAARDDAASGDVTEDSLGDAASRDVASDVASEVGGDTAMDAHSDGAIDAPTPSCTDGEQNGDETAVDCGGSCEGCDNGEACATETDCLSGRCDSAVCRSPDGTHEDIIRIAEVPGRTPGGRSWADSYSVGSECYCETTFDHNIGTIMVDTPAGPRTVEQVCEALGEGPGSTDRPLYNDVQCGNGPANDAGDEDDCPGRVDIGPDGCGHIGPRWNLAVFE